MEFRTSICSTNVFGNLKMYVISYQICNNMYMSLSFFVYPPKCIEFRTSICNTNVFGNLKMYVISYQTCKTILYEFILFCLPAQIYAI